MIRQQFIARINLLSWLLPGLVVLALAIRGVPALAQDEGFGSGDRVNTLEVPVEPPLIKAKVVTEIAEALGLDPSQSELVRALHQGYVDMFTKAATEHRDRLKALMDEANDSGDWMSVGMEWQETQRVWLERRQKVGLDFFENVKATLMPEQLAKWSTFERDRRRRTLLDVGAFFAGEGVDIVELVDELKLEPAQRAVIAPLIESYTVELDGLLQQRIRAAEDVRNIDYMNANSEADIFDRFERVLAVRRQIRDVNRKHAQIIATSIPGPASELLTGEFHRTSYPRIYSPTQAESYIEKVLALDDLSDDQRRGVEGVAMMYRDQVAIANRSLSQLLADHEDSIEQSLKGGNPMILAMVGGMSAFADEAMGQQQMPFDAKDLLMDEDQESRQNDLYRQKREFVVAAIEQVWSVLNPSQQSRATKPDVPEDTEEQKALKQVRTMMRQSMQYAEEMVREAEAQQGEAEPSR